MIGTKKYTGKNGKDFVIRLACADDFKESIETYTEVAREKIYLNTEEPTPDILEVWNERWKHNGTNMLFCVAQSEGKLTGGLVLTPYSRSPKTAHVLNLGMWLIKENRGQGMGSALMDYALEWASQEHGIRKIVLGVWNTNLRAIALYNKFGFHIEGCHRNIAKIQDKLVDEILMSCDL